MKYLLCVPVKSTQKTLIFLNCSSCERSPASIEYVHLVRLQCNSNTLVDDESLVRVNSLKRILSCALEFDRCL